MAELITNDEQASSGDALQPHPPDLSMPQIQYNTPSLPDIEASSIELMGTQQSGERVLKTVPVEVPIPSPQVPQAMSLGDHTLQTPQVQTSAANIPVPKVVVSEGQVMGDLPFAATGAECQLLQTACSEPPPDVRTYPVGPHREVSEPVLRPGGPKEFELDSGNSPNHVAKRVKTESGLPTGSVPESQGFGWRICGEKSDNERIAIKEYAVMRAEELSEQLCGIVSSYAEDATFPGANSLREWTKANASRKNEDREFEILVGVAGQTGAGKTSLLNALLGVSELLPSGQDQAATAVCCKVAWNDDYSAGHENRAIVYFQSYNEIKADLVLALKAIGVMLRKQQRQLQEEDLGSEDTGEDITEELSAAQEGLKKIECVWSMDEDQVIEKIRPRMKAIDYEDLATIIINSHRDVRGLLHKGSKTFYHSDVTDLAREIKPYLDSTTASHGQAGEFAAWPLIRNVDMFLRSPILQSGICLVDLPGVGDNVKSRAKVAEDYFEKLDVTLVVAQIHRAADEQNTQNLLNDYQEMRMQMSEGSKKYSLGVVLSKMDDMDINAYIKNAKEARGDPLVEKHQAAVSSAREQQISLEKQQKALKRETSKIQNKVQKLRERIEASKTSKPCASDSKSAAKLQGKADANRVSLKDLETQLGNEQKKMEAIDHQLLAQLKIIDLSSMHLTHWAVKIRNAKVQARMCTDFKKRRLQMRRNQQRREASQVVEESCHDDLEVMSTSVKAYWSLRSKSRAMAAFPKETYTGVPLVQQWIYKATAQRREEHLDCMLARLSISLNSLVSWCENQTMDRAIGLDVEVVEKTVLEARNVLRQGLVASLMDFHTQVRKVNPLENEEKSQEAFRKKAEKVAMSWPKKFPKDKNRDIKMAWATYKAIVVRYGGPYKSRTVPDTIYEWTSQLAAAVLRPLTRTWNSKIHVGIPHLWESYPPRMSLLWIEHYNELMNFARDTDPTLASCFKDLKDPLLQINEYIKTSGKKLIREFGKNATSGHGVIKEAVDNDMASTFAEAQTIHGTGSYERMRELIQTSVADNGARLFSRCWTSMDNNLREKKKQLGKSLTALADEAIKNAEAQTRLLLDQVLGTPDTPNRLTLQSHIKKLLINWQKEWQFPTGGLDHILMQNLGIPAVLAEEDLKIYDEVDDVDDSNDGSTTDDEDSE